MIARGHVVKGVIVLEDGVQLPEGAAVQVYLDVAGGAGRSSEFAAVRETIRHIAALPLEGLTEPFSGSQHDEAIYGPRR